jgi:hypothetical protein
MTPTHSKSALLPIKINSKTKSTKTKLSQLLAKIDEENEEEKSFRKSGTKFELTQQAQIVRADSGFIAEMSPLPNSEASFKNKDL